MVLSQDFSIKRLEDLPEQIHTLHAQAVAEGFWFLTRLITEWENRTTQFDQPGECLLGVFRHDQLVAIGGVSRDPYSTADNGRIRRVYVAPPMRGQQVGKTLVEQLLAFAAMHFQTVRLTTDTAQGAAFYLQCGFHSVTDATATHAKSVK